HLNRPPRYPTDGQRPLRWQVRRGNLNLRHGSSIQPPIKLHHDTTIRRPLTRLETEVQCTSVHMASQEGVAWDVFALAVPEGLRGEVFDFPLIVHRRIVQAGNGTVG